MTTSQENYARRTANFFNECNFYEYNGAMTEKYKIAIVGAASLRGKELNEVLTESAFGAAEFVLIDDESQVGKLEAAGDEPTFIRRIERDSLDQVDFALKELRLGRGWYIVATHPSGQQENIDGFHCEAEAREWIEGSRAFQSWLRTRGYERAA